jgi:hypothetical protein
MNGRAGSYDSSTFSVLRKLHADFHSGWTGLHSYQQRVRVPRAPPPPSSHTSLLVFVFLYDSHSGVRWNFNVVLIYIFLITKDVKHFFMYLFAICTSSFVNFLFNSFFHLLIGLFVLCVCVCYIFWI